MDTSEKIDWKVEQQRFMEVAYKRTLAAAHDAFRKWHSRKRDDAVAEMVGKMWDQWTTAAHEGQGPGADDRDAAQVGEPVGALRSQDRRAGAGTRTSSTTGPG